MKHFVINLAHRTDRKQSFIEQAGDRFEYEFFDAIPADAVDHMVTDQLEGWIDPILKRPITPAEIGCLLSHYMLWKKCIELDEPIVIFEDDIKLLDYDEDKVEAALKAFDFMYISRRPMGKDKTVGQTYVIPGYSYWLCAYAITPQAARQLVNTDILDKLIPADEYVPARLGVHPDKLIMDTFGGSIEACAHVEDMCKPYSRYIMGSDIEMMTATPCSVVTVASDITKAQTLIKSAKANGIQLTVLGRGHPWEGGDMSSTGGGQKVNELKNYLAKCQDDQLVLFVDGYDVLINDSLEEIIERFKSFECDVVFAAERTCWPHDDELYRKQLDVQTLSGYPFLNSGCFIGYARVLKEITDFIEPSSDDQQYYQRQYVSGNWNIKLDHEAYVFICLAGTSPYTSIKENGQLLNSETNCCPCILHGNGGLNDKALFNKLAKQLGYIGNVVDFIETSYYDIVDQDMITMSFLAPEYCQKLIELAEQKGTWTPMPGDKFPAQEIRLWDIDPKLFEEFELHWQKHIKPVIENYWSPMMHYNIRDAFVMKYTLDTQKSLALHTDASLVTGSVKLNDDYEGGELYFPRQDKSNADIAVGEMLLFPGQVTHGHMCNELISGTKYSLTIWTSRYRGDINK